MSVIDDILDKYNEMKPCEKVEYILNALIRLDDLGRSKTEDAIQNGDFPNDELVELADLMLQGTAHLYHAMREAKECCALRDMLMEGPDGTPGDIVQ